MFGSFRDWMLRLRRRQMRAPEECVQYPVPQLLIGLVSSPQQPLLTHKVSVNSLNEEQFVCKSHELFSEGQIMSLELTLPSVGPLVFKVQVEWVLVCSFGHSIGFRIQHSGASREMLQHFIARLKSAQTV